MAAARAELFHRISEGDSAAARRRAGELGLLGRLELRNVERRSPPAQRRAAPACSVSLLAGLRAASCEDRV
jgi:hypothetical protein